MKKLLRTTLCFVLIGAFFATSLFTDPFSDAALGVEVSTSAIDDTAYEDVLSIASDDTTVVDTDDTTETDASASDDVVEEDRAMGDSYYDSLDVSEDTLLLSIASVPDAPSNTVATGIDISHHQGSIDFSKLASEVDFIIIRCGYGGDYTSQDDTRFEEYVKGCVEYNIPFGVYLYSYATTTKKATSEADHTLRMLSYLEEWGAELSLPVFYDIEDSSQSTLSASTLASIAKTYCSALEAEGYPTGVYSSKNWWTNLLTDSYFDGVTKWVAQYNTSCSYTGTYSMWQCCSDATLSGISTNVDLDYMLEDLFFTYDISDATVSSISDQLYTGEAIKPGITVTYGNATLKKGTDYTLSYSDNVDVGTATITITGKGKYTGSKTVTFTITDEQTSIKTATVSLSYTSKTYSGKALKPTPTVTINGVELTKGTDYSVSYSNNTNVGTATVTIKGKGLYTGTTTKTFKITARKISSATATLSYTKKAYTGSKLKPSVTLTYNDVTLTKNTDYTVSYSNNTKLGKATVTITGKGNFTGTKTKYFYIIPKAVKITSTTSAKNYINVYYSAAASGTTGYQIAYRKKGTTKWYYTGCSSKYTGCKVSGLKKGTTYQFKVRPYVTINGTKYYGSYSSVKTAKTKS